MDTFSNQITWPLENQHPQVAAPLAMANAESIH